MEKNLIELLLLANIKHDKEAMELIIEKFTPLLKKTSYILNYDGAESDLIIYLIDKIFNLDSSKIERLHEEGQAVNYVARMIKNKGVDLHRKMVHQPEEIGLESLGELPQATYEENNSTWEYLEFLNERQKNVILMKYYYGFSDVEIGKKMGISRQAVNKINRKAIEIIYNQIRGEDKWIHK